MSQFAIHRNKNPNSRASYPFLLDVQSDLLDDLQTHVVIPMTRAASLTKKPIRRLMPLVRFEGEVFALMTPQLAGIPRRELGPPIGSLAQQREAIIAAMDFLLTGV